MSMEGLIDRLVSDECGEERGGQHRTLKRSAMWSQ